MGDGRDMFDVDGGSPSGSATSRGLIERVQADDAEAWERLLRLYGPLVLAWSRSLGLKDQDVADVFQEVFASVAAHIGQFRRDRPGDSFRGWLRTITRNKVYDQFRRLGRQPEGEGGTEAQMRMAQLAACEEPPTSESGTGVSRDPPEPSLFEQGLEVIKGEFEERTWLAFWRTAVDGRTPKDVGAELSMSAGAVRVAKSRVLHRLRQELGE